MFRQFFTRTLPRTADRAADRARRKAMRVELRRARSEYRINTRAVRARIAREGA